MDVPETTGSTSNSTVIAVAVVFFTVLLCLPMIGYLIWIWRPLRVNGNATRLRRGWHLTHVTGEVLASDRLTQTFSTEYGPDPHRPYGGRRVVTKTYVYDTLNLRLADGRTTNEQVVNFNVTAFPHQIVSFWTARKRTGAFTFAVLNHTTRQQNVNDHQLFSIQLAPGLQIVFVIYLAFLVIPIALLTIPGHGIPLLIFLGLLILFFIGQRRARRRFGVKGLATIWQVSQAEAQQMMAR